MPEPPSGEGWIHEIKYDGYRTLIVIEKGTASYRAGLDGLLSPAGRTLR